MAMTELTTFRETVRAPRTFLAVAGNGVRRSGTSEADHLQRRQDFFELRDRHRDGQGRLLRLRGHGAALRRNEPSLFVHFLLRISDLHDKDTRVAVNRTGARTVQTRDRGKIRVRIGRLAAERFPRMR